MTTDAAAPIALVTGGLTRLGAAIAARLARDGYALVLHSRAGGTPDPALASVLADTGVPVAQVTGDLADPAALAAIIPAATAAFGRAPMVLVNNASVFADSRWDTLDAVVMASTLAVNLTAPVLLSTALVAARGDDPAPTRIVNLLDQRVVQPVPDQLAYTLSKQALWQATRTLALAFGARARVHGVAPGLTLPTPDYDAAQMARLAARMPLGRLPDPAAIADAVALLIGMDAATGQMLFVDGGAHLVGMGRDFLFLDRAED